MMPKINTSKITYILWSMLLGMASFLISGVIACIVIVLLDNYILATIIAGGIGGFLLPKEYNKQDMMDILSSTADDVIMSAKLRKGFYNEQKSYS